MINFKVEYNGKFYTVDGLDVKGESGKTINNKRLNKFVAEYILEELNVFQNSHESIFNKSCKLIKTNNKYDELNNCFYKLKQAKSLSNLAQKYRSRTLSISNKPYQDFRYSVQRVLSDIYYSYDDFSESKNLNSILLDLYLTYLKQETVSLYCYYSYHDFLEIYEEKGFDELTKHFEDFDKNSLISLIDRDFKAIDFMSVIADCLAKRISNYNDVIIDIQAYYQVKPLLEVKDLISLTAIKSRNLLDRNDIFYKNSNTIWNMLKSDIEKIPQDIKNQLNPEIIIIEDEKITQKDILRFLKSEVLVSLGYRSSFSEKMKILISKANLDTWKKLVKYTQETKTGIARWERTDSSIKNRIQNDIIKKDKKKEYKTLIQDRFNTNIDFFLEYNLTHKEFYAGLWKNKSSLTTEEIDRIIKHPKFKNLKLTNKIIFSKDITKEVSTYYTKEELIEAVFQNILQEKKSYLFKTLEIKNEIYDSFLNTESRLIKNLPTNKKDAILGFYHWSFYNNKNLVHVFEKELRSSSNKDLIARIFQLKDPTGFFDIIEKHLENSNKYLNLISEWDAKIISSFYNFIKEDNKIKIIKESFSKESILGDYSKREIQKIIFSKDKTEFTFIKKAIFGIKGQIHIMCCHDSINVLNKEDWEFCLNNLEKVILENFIDEKDISYYYHDNVRLYRKVISQFTKKELLKTKIFKNASLFEPISFYSHPIIVKYGASLYKKEKNGLIKIIQNLNFHFEDLSFVLNNIDEMSEDLIKTLWNTKNEEILKKIKNSINSNGVRSNNDKEKLNIIRSKVNQIKNISTKKTEFEFVSLLNKDKLNTEKEIQRYLFLSKDILTTVKKSISSLSSSINVYLNKKELYNKCFTELVTDRDVLPKLIKLLNGEKISLEIVDSIFEINSSERVQALALITDSQYRSYNNRERNYSIFEKISCLDFLCDEDTIKERNFLDNIKTAIPYDSRYRRNGIGFSEDAISKNIIKKIISCIDNKDNKENIDIIINKLNLSEDLEIKKFRNKNEFMKGLNY